jgi:hypothetical protein
VRISNEFVGLIPFHLSYSSTLNSPKKSTQTPTKHLEQFHTKTTTLRSNKDQQQPPPPQTSIEQMDNKVRFIIVLKIIRKLSLKQF